MKEKCRLRNRNRRISEGKKKKMYRNQYNRKEKSGWRKYEKSIRGSLHRRRNRIEGNKRRETRREEVRRNREIIDIPLRNRYSPVISKLGLGWWREAHGYIENNLPAAIRRENRRKYIKIHQKEAHHRVKKSKKIIDYVKSGYTPRRSLNSYQKPSKSEKKKKKSESWHQHQ